MRQFIVYIVVISVGIAVVHETVTVLWGVTAGNVATVVSIYLVTLFDLRIASPQWSMFRRILPSVSAIDLAVYALPFAYMIALISGWLPNQDEPILAFIVALPLLFVWGLYLLMRLPRMRRGSRDDLSWISSPNITISERLRRYLNVPTARR
jgi:hypothetical protein